LGAITGVASVLNLSHTESWKHLKETDIKECMCVIYSLLSTIFAESNILNLNYDSFYTPTGTKNQG
jgi:hypothetical protein